MGNQESFGNSSGDLEEKALAAIADFIQQVQPGGMVQKFVLLVDTIADDGHWMSAFVAPGQKRWDTMGMLAYATALEANVRISPEEDDDNTT